MPLYTYFCERCMKKFEVVVSLERSQEPVRCKYCGEEMIKVMDAPMFRIN